jgi:hypothetical protein
VDECKPLGGGTSTSGGTDPTAAASTVQLPSDSAVQRDVAALLAEFIRAGAVR